MLLIVTFRAEFQPPWIGQPQVTMLALNRLDRRDRTVLVGQIAGGKALPDEVVSRIVDRTDGVPLFVEELTKSVLESGLLREENNRYVLDRALPPLAIPTTLHDSLLARLDRLASVRRGGADRRGDRTRVFLPAVARSSLVSPRTSCRRALGRLVASELVLQRGMPPEAIYTFKHALVQDAAHGSLLRSSRQQLHAQIAEALLTHSPELMETQSELFAQHYEVAGLVEKSIACWGRAGHAPPAARRWRRRRRNSKKGWTSWRYCQKPLNASARSSNFAAPWARRCALSKARARRKSVMPLPAHESCGSGWVLPRSSFTFLMGSLAITCTAAKSIWRCAWMRICCRSAVNATIPAGSF